jgi:hypothetical protein
MKKKIHKAEDSVKYAIFADYNGYTYRLRTTPTLKSAIDWAKFIALHRKAGNRLTVRVWKQVYWLRKPKET